MGEVIRMDTYVAKRLLRKAQEVGEQVEGLMAPVEVVRCPHCGEVTPATYQWCVHCRSEWY